MIEIFNHNSTESLARCKNMAQAHNVLHYLKDTGRIPAGENRATICRYKSRMHCKVSEVELRDGRWQPVINEKPEEEIPAGLSLAVS